MTNHNKILELNWEAIKKRVILPLWNRKFRSMYENAKMDYDDFESLAGFELSKAMINFNPDKSNIFTYATGVITKKAMTELRNCTQRDKRKALHIAEGIDDFNKYIVENIECNIIRDYSKNLESQKDDMSIKMKKYLSRLSKLQIEILFAMSEGYTNEEIIARFKITTKEMTDACSAIKSYRNISILF